MAARYNDVAAQHTGLATRVQVGLQTGLASANDNRAPWTQVCDDGSVGGTPPSWGGPFVTALSLWRRGPDREWLARLYALALAAAPIPVLLIIPASHT